MPAPTTTENFLDLVRKSNLVETGRLDAYLQKVRSESTIPTDPPHMAARFVKDGILTNFQAQQLLRGRYRNFTIVGKYKILEPLGTGGMSKVFLVEHLAMGHRVAMKILPIEGNKDDAALIARFKREAKAVASLNHPNVIRAHDIDSEGTRFHYIIMEYVEGVNLHDLVRKRGPLAPDVAAHYIYQAAVGLQHVHDAGLIHRDVKPGNLLIDRDGVLKILDLGLARYESDGENLTRKFDDNAILGTADYLAPEQALRSYGLDSRADIYGLGATFYYLLIGQAPFEAEKNVTQKLLGHQMREPESIRDLRPEVPEELVAVVETMMAKKPDDRYQSAGDLAAVLMPWADVPVNPPSADELPRRSLASQGSGHSSRSPRGSSNSRSPSSARRGSSPSLGDSSSGIKSRPPASAVRGSRIPVPVPAKSKRGPIAAITGSVLALLAAGLFWWQPWASPPAPPAPPPAKIDVARNDVEPKPVPKVAQPPVPPPVDFPADALFVTSDVKPNSHPTLARALADARDGTTIVVLEPLAEQVTLGSSTPKNLRIVAGAADGVAWRPGKGDPAKPLLQVSQCDGLTLTGLHFDGDGRLATLFEIGGVCPGLKLDRLSFVGAKATDLLFGGDVAGGTADRPVRVLNCKFATRPEIAAAVAFAATTENAFVEIGASRIDGPFKAGVLLAGPVDGVTIQQTRFYAMSDGIRFAPPAPTATVRIAVVGNTFFQTPHGLGFATLPTENSHLTIQNNLFLDVDQLAMVDGFALAPVWSSAEWVWFGDDMKTTVIPENQPRFFRKVVDLPTVPTGPVTFDVGCDESFVAYVNGTQVGEGPKFFNGRVYAFDVTKLLTAGKNVLAVRAVNQKDALSAGHGSTAGLMAMLTDRAGGSAKPLAATDPSWKANRNGPDGWNTPGFDDTSWQPAKPWGNLGVVWPWKQVTWDAVVDSQMMAKGLRLPKLTLGGNVRSYTSFEGFPILDSMRGFVDEPKKIVLPRDPADANFLLYPPSHGLYRAGVDRKPVGVPGR